MIAGLEGAFVLARAWRSKEPLLVAGEVRARGAVEDGRWPSAGPRGARRAYGSRPPVVQAAAALVGAVPGMTSSRRSWTRSA